MRSDSRSSALLAHIVAQTKSNVDFLVSQNYLLASDAAGILSKLANLETDSDESQPRSPVLSVAERMRHLSTADRESSVPDRAPSPPKAVIPTRRVVPPPPPAPAPHVPLAKALWDYNENGSDPNDLSFRAGDRIEVISETNPDWWTGRLNGRQGLFPSNYVEKLFSPADNNRSSVSPGPAPIPVPEPMGVMFGQPPFSHSSSYSSLPPSAHVSFPNSGPYNAPPPPPSWQAQPYGYGNEKQQQVYAPPPPQPPQQPPQLQQQVQAPEPEKKKSKFSGLGNTMANSAAGGVGFGAGAAIGSGIINSIF